MTGALLIQDIQQEVSKFSLMRVMRNFVIHKLSLIENRLISIENNYKRDLQHLLDVLERDTVDLSGLNDLDADELKYLHKKVKRYSTLFDNLYDRYYVADFFKDAELKQLFRSICRKLHKLENACQKKLQKDFQSGTETKKYIKDGLAQISQEALGKVLKSKS